MNRKIGDWNCISCGHLNFGWREACQRCNFLKPPAAGGINPLLLAGALPMLQAAGGMGGAGGLGFPFGGLPAGFGRGTGMGGMGGPVTYRPGDWYCSGQGCGAHNFSSRMACYKCGAKKSESPGEGAPSGAGPGNPPAGFQSGVGRMAWKSGDWICPRQGCGEHNFANRNECFRCHAPKEQNAAGGAGSSQ